MILDVLIFLVSLFLIVFGAKIFVNSSVRIARKLRVSEFVIGLTLVALGTSLPELFSSVVASARHQSGLIAGTILGANIMDITVVVGAAALISVIKLKERVLKRDVYMMIFTVMLLGIFLLDKILSRIEGIIFVILFLIYNFYIFRARKEKNSNDIIKHVAKGKKKGKIEEMKLNLREIFLFILGGILLYLGAEGLVKEAVSIADSLGVSIIIIGIIISIGTTLPELSVSITSSREKKGEIAVGNAIGSVITNTLLILGISAIIFPISVAQKTANFLIPFLLGVSVLLGISIRTKWRISRIEGIILILIYALFWILTVRVI